MPVESPGYLVAVAVVAIALLLLLVMRFKWPAYIALLAVAVLTGLAANIPVQDIIPTVIAGMGGTLGSVALLVGLGAMLGGVIEKSGGAEVLAIAFTNKLGKDRVGTALLAASALVAIPIFFDVAFIILVPIIYSFAKAAGHRTPALIGMPIAVLMGFIHNAVPPHPGIVGTTGLLKGDLGLVTIFGLLLSVPMFFVVHFLFKRINKREFEMSPEVAERYASTSAAKIGEAGEGTVVTDEGTYRLPSAGLVATMIILPVALIAAGTIGAVLFDKESAAFKITQFVGAPGFALLLCSILAMYLLGIRCGWGKSAISEVMDAALGPAAIVVFVTGAGGVFAKVLTVSGVGDAVSGLVLNTGLPIYVLAFLLATIFKICQGSGTVAALTAAGLVQSTVLEGGYSSMQITLILLSIGMGSVALSHINDSGFWVASRFLGLSVGDSLRTWSVGTTVCGWLGMVIISILWLFV